MDQKNKEADAIYELLETNAVRKLLKRLASAGLRAEPGGPLSDRRLCRYCPLNFSQEPCGSSFTADALDFPVTRSEHFWFYFLVCRLVNNKE